MADDKVALCIAELVPQKVYDKILKAVDGKEENIGAFMVIAAIKEAVYYEGLDELYLNEYAEKDGS